MRIEEAPEKHKSPIQNIANINQPRIESGYILGTCLIVTYSTKALRRLQHIALLQYAAGNLNYGIKICW